LSGQHAAANFELVIERGVVQNRHGGMHGSGFGVFCAINQCPDASVDHGSRAHGAWLNGHEEIAVQQAVVAESRSRLAQGDDFGVGGWIGVGQVAVESASDYFPFVHDNRAYRHFSDVERSLSGPQRFLHPEFVGFRTSAVQHNQYCMRM
jgi:hypothetical protein